MAELVGVALLERLTVGDVLRDCVPVGEDDTLGERVPDVVIVADGLEEADMDTDAETE